MEEKSCLYHCKFCRGLDSMAGLYTCDDAQSPSEGLVFTRYHKVCEPFAIGAKSMKQIKHFREK